MKNIKNNLSNSLAKNIQNLFQYIKKDDLQNFLLLTQENNSLIQFKNKQKENLLFYSLQKGSLQISHFLIEKHEHFLYEKNRYLLTPFSNLIYTNNNIGLICVKEILHSKDQRINKVYSINGDQYNIPLLAVSKLDSDSWTTFREISEHLWGTSNLSLKTKNGLNIAHFIAIKNAKHCLDILPYCDKNIFTEIDNESGNTPFLASAYFSCPEIIEKFLPFSDITKTTQISNSNAIHLAANNANHESLLLLLEKNIFPNVKNTSNTTALMNAILEKNITNTLTLLPYYKNKDISEELLKIIEVFPKNTVFIENVINSLNLSQINTVYNDKNMLNNFLSYIFYTYNESQINQFLSGKLEKILHKLELPIAHQLYTSTIVGKKSMVFKINILQKYSSFITAEESDSYFQSSFQGEQLFFKSLAFNSNKIQKSFCFVAALGILPVSQIIEILDKTKVANFFSHGDWLLLYSIALKKKSCLLLEKFKNLPTNFIIEGSNADFCIQDNLSSFSSFEDYNLSSPFSFLYNTYPHNPKLFIKKISYDLIYNHKNLNYLKSFLSNLDNHLMKKEIVVQIMNEIMNIPVSNLNIEKIFCKNNKINVFYLNNITIDNISTIKNKSFFLNLSKSYKDCLKLVFFCVQSVNNDKLQLIEFLLNNIDPNETLNKAFKKIDLNISIDDIYWKKILNKFWKTKNFETLVALYIEQQSKFLTTTSLETLKIATKFYIPNDSFIVNVITNLTKNMTIDSNIESKIDYLIEYINPKKDFYIYKKLSLEAIKNGNFALVEHLYEKHKIPLETFQLENYWNGAVLKQDFNIGFQNSTFQPLKDYIVFFTKHKNQLTEDFWEKSSYNFYNWLISHHCNQITKINAISLFFESIQEQIINIPNKIIINICSNALESYVLYKEHSVTDIQNKNLETMLDLFFKNKEHNFFIQLQNDPTIKKNQSYFSSNQQKKLQYHLLSENLQKNTNKLEHKKVKI